LQKLYEALRQTSPRVSLWHLTKPRWRSHVLCNHEIASDGRAIWDVFGAQEIIFYDEERDDPDGDWRTVTTYRLVRR